MGRHCESFGERCSEGLSSIAGLPYSLSPIYTAAASDTMLGDYEVELEAVLTASYPTCSGELRSTLRD